MPLSGATVHNSHEGCQGTATAFPPFSVFRSSLMVLDGFLVGVGVGIWEAMREVEERGGLEWWKGGEVVREIFRAFGGGSR